MIIGPLHMAWEKGWRNVVVPFVNSDVLVSLPRD